MLSSLPYSVVALLLLAVLTTATPTAALSVPLTRRELGITLHSGAVDLQSLQAETLRTHLKYGQNKKRIKAFTEASRSARQRLIKRAVVPLSISSYSVWTGPISIGTPPQNFSIYFDTGSSDLTVPDATCSVSLCGTKARYQANVSSTAVDMNATFQSSFADGSSSFGEWFSDNVVAGGAMAPNQSVISALSLSTTVASLPSDGIMGLAYPALSSSRTNSTPFTMLSAGFGQFIGLRLSSNATVTSELTMGNFSEAYVNTTFSWYPVALTNGSDVKTYWQIANGSASVNGVSVLASRANHLIDSGTTLISGPPKGVQQFWDHVPGALPMDANHWTFPCDSPPNVTFTFGGVRPRMHFTVAADDFNLGFLWDDPTRCVGAVVAQDLGLGSAWILGDTFLKSWYTVFDMARDRIGFASPLQ